MRGAGLYLLLLLLPWCAWCQPRGFSSQGPQLEDEVEAPVDGDLMTVSILNRSGILASLLSSDLQPQVRQARASRPLPQLTKKAAQGSRFALSLDVPTSILSVLIDLAKNQDMRAKAASNAELLARIGLFSKMTMEYAKRSLSMLTPTSVSRCVSAGVAASASMTQQLLTGLNTRQRPFRVSNADRTIKKGIMADSLRDLLDKVMDGFNVSCVSALVLDEDGTGVDTEDYFQTLRDNTVLVVLEKGQKWIPTVQTTVVKAQHVSRSAGCRKDVAKLTFDLYKNHPKEFIGCLNVKATLYGVYTVSYNLRCYEAKRILKEALRWTLLTMQTTGHVLLGTSCYMQALLEEEEQEQQAEEHLKAMKAGEKCYVPGYLWGKSAV